MRDAAIAREDDAALRAYFAADYVFHGPGGELGFDELSAYFAALRAAFSGLRLVREQTRGRKRNGGIGKPARLPVTARRGPR